MGKGTIICMFAAAFVLLPKAAPAEISLGAGKDVVHAQRTWALVGRYDHRGSGLGLQGMLWNGPEQRANSSVGLDYNLLGLFWKGPIDLNIGGAWISDIDRINGTHFNYSLGGAWNPTRRLRIQFTHFSNGHSKNNNGWNFLLLMYRL